MATVVRFSEGFNPVIGQAPLNNATLISRDTILIPSDGAVAIKGGGGVEGAGGVDLVFADKQTNRQLNCLQRGIEGFIQGIILPAPSYGQGPSPLDVVSPQHEGSSNEKFGRRRLLINTVGTVISNTSDLLVTDVSAPIKRKEGDPKDWISAILEFSPNIDFSHLDDPTGDRDNSIPLWHGIWFIPHKKGLESRELNFRTGNWRTHDQVEEPLGTLKLALFGATRGDHIEKPSLFSSQFTEDPDGNPIALENSDRYNFLGTSSVYALRRSILQVIGRLTCLPDSDLITHVDNNYKNHEMSRKLRIAMEEDRARVEGHKRRR